MRTRISRFLLLLLGVFFMAAALSGCAKKKGPEEIFGPEQGIYRIYYLDSAQLSLGVSPYKAEATEIDDIINELKDKLETKDPEIELIPVFDENVEIVDISRNANLITVSVNDQYQRMTPNREILCRAAIVKTLTQIPGVDYVTFDCEGHSLVDSYNNPLGVFAGSDFVDSISNVNSFEKVTLILYFAEETGTALVKETRDVTYNMNNSLERLVVEQLINGSSQGRGNVIPKDVRINNVSVQDMTAYVNLNSAFLNSDVEVADYIPIYAITNSLTELQTVSRVQITVNGSADVMYRNSISLSEAFERDEQYIVR